jgi:hypothetical protein
MSSPEKYIIERIIEILQQVQGGKVGEPTMHALDMCGQLHAILEGSVLYKQQSSE